MSESETQPASQPETQAQSHSSVHSNVRTKTDEAWEYTNLVTEANGKKVHICKFCDKIIRGGGINRVKKHLAGIKGEVEPCKRVPADVRFTMKGILKQVEVKGKGNAKDVGGSVNILDDDEVEEIPLERKKQSQKGKRKATSEVHPFFTKGINDPSQPSIKKAMQTKKKLHDVDLAIAMWFYDACIPINACNSPYFQLAVNKIAGIGHGYKAPNYHSLRVNLLNDAKKHVSLLIDFYRSEWVECGCTIMSDGWRDIRQCHLINFLIYCEKGISFIKSVDASDIESNSENLCNFFPEIVDMVGPKNVVQMVNDNAANYKLAGKLLSDRYRTITWSPCAAHCLNLILKDVGELENVSSLVKLASRVTVFIYNHKSSLNWLRKRPGWTEIIHPTTTRFGTAFIALKSLVDHKNDLFALVISNDFKKMLKVRNAVEFRQIVMNENFWNNCLITVKVMTPLLRLLRVCDVDEKPSLAYVYEGMNRARKGIKELFKKKKHLYKPYTDIIDRRWDKMLRSSIHCAAYWLNPQFQYDKTNLCRKDEVFAGVLDMVEKQFHGEDVQNVIMALGKFRDGVGSFGRSSATACRHTSQPAEWWRLFGDGYPLMQTFAIRILSQTASSSGCERSWSVFERIHTKKRNRLEHQRLNDLVYVHYNLRLKNRKTLKENLIMMIWKTCLMSSTKTKTKTKTRLFKQTTTCYISLDYDENDDGEFQLLSDRVLDAYNTPMSQ